MWLPLVRIIREMRLLKGESADSWLEFLPLSVAC